MDGSGPGRGWGRVTIKLLKQENECQVVGRDQNYSQDKEKAQIIIKYHKAAQPHTAISRYWLTKGPRPL